eukprot:Awhi_evm1s6557
MSQARLSSSSTMVSNRNQLLANHSAYRENSVSRTEVRANVLRKNPSQPFLRPNSVAPSLPKQIISCEIVDINKAPLKQSQRDSLRPSFSQQQQQKQNQQNQTSEVFTNASNEKYLTSSTSRRASSPVINNGMFNISSNDSGRTSRQNRIRSSSSMSGSTLGYEHISGYIVDPLHQSSSSRRYSTSSSNYNYPGTSNGNHVNKMHPHSGTSLDSRARPKSRQLLEQGQPFDSRQRPESRAMLESRSNFNQERIQRPDSRQTLEHKNSRQTMVDLRHASDARQRAEARPKLDGRNEMLDKSQTLASKNMLDNSFDERETMDRRQEGRQEGRQEKQYNDIHLNQRKPDVINTGDKRRSSHDKYDESHGSRNGIGNGNGRLSRSNSRSTMVIRSGRRTPDSRNIMKDKNEGRRSVIEESGSKTRRSISRNMMDYRSGENESQRSKLRNTNEDGIYASRRHSKGERDRSQGRPQGRSQERSKSRNMINSRTQIERNDLNSQNFTSSFQGDYCVDPHCDCGNKPSGGTNFHYDSQGSFYENAESVIGNESHAYYSHGNEANDVTKFSNCGDPNCRDSNCGSISNEQKREINYLPPKRKENYKLPPPVPKSRHPIVNQRHQSPSRNHETPIILDENLLKHNDKQIDIDEDSQSFHSITLENGNDENMIKNTITNSSASFESNRSCMIKINRTKGDLSSDQSRLGGDRGIEATNSNNERISIKSASSSRSANSDSGPSTRIISVEPTDYSSNSYLQEKEKKSIRRISASNNLHQSTTEIESNLLKSHSEPIRDIVIDRPSPSVSFGVMVYKTISGLVVVSITKNSPASQVGLQFFDEILAVNNQNALGWSSKECVEAMSEGLVCTLKVKAQVATKVTVLTRTRYRMQSMCGIEITNGIISGCKQNSIAEKAGIEIDHVVLAISNVSVVGETDEYIKETFKKAGRTFSLRTMSVSHFSNITQDLDLNCMRRTKAAMKRRVQH